MDKKSGDKSWKLRKGRLQAPGVYVTQKGLSCVVEVSKGKTFELVLYEKKNGTRDVILVGDDYRMGNMLLFIVETEQEVFLSENYEYTFCIDGVEQLDRYSRALMGRRRFGYWKEEELRSGFASTDYDWKKDCILEIPLDEIILYTLHVRGFTRHSSSGIEARGTFKGVMEKAPYLKKLGVNQVELMPVYEFAETIPQDSMTKEWYRDEKGRVRKNYWGYSNNNYYFAVKQTYAFGSDAAAEFCDMVCALHEHGIEVVLEFYFPHGTRMALVREVLIYWATQYHIDGFHLTGEQLCLKELLEEPLLADRKLYGADLFGCEGGENYKEPSWLRRAAVSNVDYMKSIRGFLKGDAGVRVDAAYHMRKNMADYGFVNYITSHDGFTLCDLVSYDHKHNEKNGEDNRDGWDYNYSWNCGVEGRTRKLRLLELRLRQMKNAWMMLLLSQGVPAILAGDECGNSQDGNNNAYCQDNEIGWVNWKCHSCYEELYVFAQRLISLRREHPVFHMREMKLLDHKGIGYPDISYHTDKAWFVDPYVPVSYLGILLCGEYAVRADGTPDASFYMACNMDWNCQRFALPDAPCGGVWRYVLTTHKDTSLERTAVKERMLEVPPRTIVLLMEEKGQENKKYGTGRKKKRI